MERRPDFEGMKVEELKEFLRKCCAKLGGKKAELYQRAIDYFNARGNPTSTIPDTSVNVAAEILEELDNDRNAFNQIGDWRPITDMSRSGIPNGFDIDTISNFLTTAVFNFEDEEIPSGTEKPSKKGQAMYSNGKIQHCEYLEKEDLIVFRANVEASLSTNTFR